MKLSTTLQQHYLKFLARRLAKQLDASWKPWSAQFSAVSAKSPVVSQVTVGAVQFSLSPVTQLPHWYKRLTAIYEQARHEGCDVLVFPEDMPTPLLGVLRRWLPGKRRSPPPAQVGAFLRTLGPVTYRHWIRVMQAYAEHYHILTVAGSGITEIDGCLLNQSVVISADGEVVAEQPKMHLFAFEQDWGLCAGDLTKQNHTGWNLHAVVCNDATYFESFRMARHLGADLVAVPIADPEAHYSENKAMRGTWARVQETRVAGIVGAGTGSLFGFTCSGKAGIYLPAALTPDGSGILAQSPDPIGEGMVSGIIDLDALHAFQSQSPSMPAGPWHKLYQQPL